MAIAATHNTTQRGPPSSKTSRELLPLCALVVLAAFLIELLIPQRPSHVPYTSDLVLVTTDANQQFVYVDIALATQPFKVVLDTGSALTWILSENFTCFHNAVKLPQADCQVGSLYQIDRNFSSIPDEIVHMSYEPMSVMGFPGRTSVTLAGLTTTAKVGIVTKLVSHPSNFTISTLIELDQQRNIISRLWSSRSRSLPRLRRMDSDQHRS